MHESEFIVPDWPAAPHVKALSTTRVGGVSQGPFRSLNLGTHVGDIEEKVFENRLILQRGARLPSSPVWLNQTHSDRLVELPCAGHQAPLQADASFTRRNDIVCAVMTADCLPVLLTDVEGNQVAAVHAGWRGLASGIIERSVRYFDAEPSHLIAWLGPCIGPTAFEIGVELRAVLGGPDSAFIAHPTDDQKLLANLPKLAKNRLASMGVTECFSSMQCTYSDADRFFSYRRDGQTGRMASLIWLDA